jgi:hypothetical protein
MQKEEVDALYRCSIADLIRAHEDRAYSFTAHGIGNHKDEGVQISRQVSAESFPFNWDNYHYKMALLARRFARGEKGLVY